MNKFNYYKIYSIIIEYMYIFIFFICRCDEVDSNRLRPHLLRTSDYCWCDKDAIDHFNEVQNLNTR